MQCVIFTYSSTPLNRVHNRLVTFGLCGCAIKLFEMTRCEVTLRHIDASQPIRDVTYYHSPWTEILRD